MKLFRSSSLKASLVFLAVFAVGASEAAGISDIVAAVDFVDILAAVMGVGVLIIGIDLAQLGYQKVRRIVKGAH